MNDHQWDSAIAELEEGSARPENITAILTAPDAEQARLWQAAHNRRLAVFGREVYLRAIIEFSNYCWRNCYYCGLRQPNRSLTRYRMNFEEIMSSADEAAAAGYGTVILQSGEDPYYKRDFIRDLVLEIKRRHPAVAVTLSLGERSYDELKTFRQAGADRYLLKHETADENLYKKIHPGHTLAQRLLVYEHLRDLGYVVGGGFMLGLGEAADNAALAAGDTLLLKKISPGMAGVGPFLPHPQTPMAAHHPGPGLTTLSVMAILRLLIPAIHLPMTTALSTHYPELEFKALETGANVIMKKVEPDQYAGLYEIYPKSLQKGVQSVKEKFLTLKTGLVNQNWMVL